MVYTRSQSSPSLNGLDKPGLSFGRDSIKVFHKQTPVRTPQTGQRRRTIQKSILRNSKSVNNLRSMFDDAAGVRNTVNQNIGNAPKRTLGSQNISRVSKTMAPTIPRTVATMSIQERRDYFGISTVTALTSKTKDQLLAMMKQCQDGGLSTPAFQPRTIRKIVMIHWMRENVFIL
mmetsp:Transcript_37080/g.42310  ORF Transcript_37080/g.42310 Transcript_37080/m.42310 type:complete len:175 (+) Transcript_37080:227-751(+)